MELLLSLLLWSLYNIYYYCIAKATNLSHYFGCKTKLEAGAPTSNIIHFIYRTSSIHFPLIITFYSYHTSPTAETIFLPTPSLPLSSLLNPPNIYPMHPYHFFNPFPLSLLLPQESSYPFLPPSM